IIRREALYILDVQKEQPVTILPYGFHRIATTLLVVGDIQLEFDVARVGGAHDPVNFIGRFTQTSHVVVIPQRNAEASGPLPDLSEEAAELLEVRSFRLPIFWPG